MRAAVFHGQRDVRIDEVPDLNRPGPTDVTLDILKAAICGTDASEWAHGPKMAPLHSPHPVTGVYGPVVLGHEFVGIVRDAGEMVEGLAIGDRVVPGCGAWCGSCLWCRRGETQLCRSRYLIGMHRDGGLAEAAIVPAAMCRPVAASMSDEAAAIAQPLAVAVHGLENGHVRDGPIVVIGAGGIGGLVIAAALARGVAPIIVVDISEVRLERAAELGAAHGLFADDPALDDTIVQLTGGDGPEVVVEASGAAPAPALAARLVRPGGRIVLMGMQDAPRELDLFALAQWEVQILPSNAHVCQRDLPAALAMLAETDLAERVIGSRIGLGRLVDDGLAPLADGRANGKVVVDPHS